MYPIMLNLSQKKVLVVGGGNIASRKIKGLLVSKANLTVISPEMESSIPGNKVNWVKRRYEAGDACGYDLVFACTNSEEVNSWVAKECEPSQWVNNVSDKAQSDFYNMATICSEEMLLGVSSFGKNPKKSKELKKDLEVWLETRDN